MPPVTTYLVEVMPKLFRLDTLPMVRSVLLPRETEVLERTSTDKSTWEIGQILSISKSTGNAHLGRVRGAFGVSTKAHAIARTSMLGMLTAWSPPDAPQRRSTRSCKGLPLTP